jgi:DNA mismatch repair protein MutS2
MTRVDPQTCNTLGVPLIRTALRDMARSEPGQGWLAQLEPAENQGTRDLRALHVSEAQSLRARDLEPGFANLFDISDLSSHLRDGRLIDTESLAALGSLCNHLFEIKKHLKALDAESPILSALASQIPDTEHLRGQLLSCVGLDGSILDNATPALASLRKRSKALHQRTRDRFDKLVHDKRIEVPLQDNFYTLRNERYVIPVKAGEQSEVRGIIHARSSSGETVFIEPEEMIGANNELKLLNGEISEEEHRVVRDLCEVVLAFLPALEGAVAQSAELDGWFTIARFADLYRLEAAECGESTNDIDLRTVRNPTLLLSEKHPVPTHIFFPDDVAWLIISGPNAGGKSVSLSSLGLCAWMHACGLPVPCDKGSRIPLFGAIAMVAGDAQDMEADLSTFSGHLTRLTSLLGSLKKGDLLVIDEPMDGTDPDQGAALAQALLEFANEQGIVGAVSTHFPRLKHMGGNQPGFANARVEFQAAQIPHRYGFEIGSAASSEPFNLARSVSFPEEIIDRASDILGPDMRVAESLKENLHERIEAVEEERTALEGEKQKAMLAAEGLATAKMAQESRGDEHIERSVKRTLSRLDKALSTVRDIVRDLQSNPSSEKARRASERIRKIQEEVQPFREALKAPPEASVEEAPKGWTPTPGDWVQVCSLRKEAKVTHIKGQNVELQAGAIRITRPLADLRPLSKAPEIKKPPVTPIRVDKSEEINSVTLDIRGLRVDEALAQLDHFIDRGILENRTELLIVHGHGTAALKRAVREFARQHPAIEKHGAENREATNDGATLITLK